MVTPSFHHALQNLMNNRNLGSEGGILWENHSNIDKFVKEILGVLPVADQGNWLILSRKAERRVLVSALEGDFQG